MKKIKVGFLIDGLKVNSYVYDLIQHVDKSNFFLAPVLIHGHHVKKSKYQQIRFLLNKLGFIKFINRLLIILLSKLIKRIEISSALKSYPLYLENTFLNKSTDYKNILVNGKWSNSMVYLDFTEADIDLLRDEKFDCIVRCGSGILTGKVLNIPKYGVLSFHHGDNRINRGGPSGFWEVFLDQPSSGFVIQKLNEELDGGNILYRGNIMTSWNWTLNNSQLLEKSNFFLKKILENIAETGRLPDFEDPRLHGEKLLKLDTPKILLSYLFFKLGPTVSKMIIKKYISRKVIRWSVAYSKHNDFSKSLWRYKEINNPPGRFLADPFVFKYNKKTVIFVEDYSYSDKKGRISVYDISNNSEKFEGVILEEDYHLSFPFVFEDNGIVFMIPETNHINEIRMYECLDFPKKWKFKKTLMSNVDASDTVMIERDGLWYMLTNICSSGINDHNSELHIFYSDDILTDEWRPIDCGNPVIFDCQSARNGGIFYKNNELYRINQIQGKSHYGKSFGVNKVLTLNPFKYSEVRVGNIDSNHKSNIFCTHHYSANSEFAAVDFARITSKS